VGIYSKWAFINSLKWFEIKLVELEVHSFPDPSFIYLQGNFQQLDAPIYIMKSYRYVQECKISTNKQKLSITDSKNYKFTI